AQTAVRVKTAIVNDADLGQRAIEVRVSRGVARLTGVVWTAAESARAVELARAVSGVSHVDSDLEIRAPSPGGRFDPADPDPVEERPKADNPYAPGLIAIGLAVGTRQSPDDQLLSTWTVGPLVRIGAARGLGLTLGFSWYQTDLSSDPTAAASVGRLNIRPVMAGLEYTIRRDRHALAASLVGGVAFNSYKIESAGGGERVAVAVGNSLAVRPGVTFWYEASRRIALHVFGGYVITRPDVTYLRDGRLERGDLRGDAAIVNAGVAYKLF
ncbi:MAG: BON domain-containing protein, partial [Acidobacteriota bacterium]